MSKKNFLKEEIETVENEEYVPEESIGEIKIADEVLAVCAINAAMKVDGVAGFAGGLVEDFAENYLKIESTSKGVSLKQTDLGVILDLYINVLYGCKIPQVAWDVQNAVKAEIESMTERKVAKVNIHVQGVKTKENLKKKDRDEG